MEDLGCVCVIEYIYPAAYGPNGSWQLPGFPNEHGQIPVLEYRSMYGDGG